jgi:hypothetical protein
LLILRANTQAKNAGCRQTELGDRNTALEKTKTLAERQGFF